MSSSSRDARLRLRNESRKQQKLLPREYRTKLRQLCEITQTDPKTFARSTKAGDAKVTYDREKSDTVVARCLICSKGEIVGSSALPAGTHCVFLVAAGKGRLIGGVTREIKRVTSRDDKGMSKEGCGTSQEGVRIHTHAARHYGEAAKHHEAGHHEKAAYHAHTARAHASDARGYAEEATSVTPRSLAKNIPEMHMPNEGRNELVTCKNRHVHAIGGEIPIAFLARRSSHLVDTKLTS
jgi:hypothetical protein